MGARIEQRPRAVKHLSAEQNPLAILVVTPGSLPREEIRRALSRDANVAVCAEASGMEYAFIAVAAANPSLVLLDKALADACLEGKASRRWRCDPAVPILAVSTEGQAPRAEYVLCRRGSGRYGKEPLGTDLLTGIRMVRQSAGHPCRPDTHHRHRVLVLRAREYAVRNLDRPPTLHGAAKALRVSPWHLCRTFTDLTGESFATFVRKEKLQRVKRLIAETRMTIKEIAHTSGFKNADHFCAWFRKNSGLSATAYRARVVGD